MRHYVPHIRGDFLVFNEPSSLKIPIIGALVDMVFSYTIRSGRLKGEASVSQNLQDPFMGGCS